MKIENSLVVIGLIQLSMMSLWYWRSDRSIRYMEGITKWNFSADPDVFPGNIVRVISTTADRSFFSSFEKEKVSNAPFLTLDCRL